MKVLFILKNENFMAPIGLCAVSAAALKEGHETYLCEMNSQDPLESIRKLKPDVVAYSASSGEAKHYLKLNRAIKESFPNVFSIMGGPHATFHPDVVYKDSLDAICVGEGEGSFVELLRSISEKKSPDVVSNIVTRSNGDRFIVRDLIKDLDSLPFPDYSLVYDNTPLGKYPLKSIITSRGCPYNCTYCFNAAWREVYKGKGKAVRRHSVDYVIGEIRYVKEKWPLSCVKFYDDIFVYGVDDWLEEFSKKYKREIDLPFFILTRAELLTEDAVKLLKYAGCRTVSMSIEAGNRAIREKMLKRNMADKEIINAHRLCDKYGIYTFTNCIIGLPETSISNDIESVDLSIASGVTWAEFPVFYPYPGTELGQKTIEKGLYKEDFKNMHTSYQNKSLLSCFSEREKNAQMNIALLGPVATVFPYLRNLILGRLIYIRRNFFFTFLYYITKMYVFRKKIYVTKTNLWVSLRIFTRSLKQEWFKHENSKG